MKDSLRYTTEIASNIFEIPTTYTNFIHFIINKAQLKKEN